MRPMRPISLLTVKLTFKVLEMFEMKNLEKLKSGLSDVKSLQEIVPLNLGDDPLYTIIDITKELKDRHQMLVTINRLLGFFGSLSMIMAIISTVFYQNKQHLQLMGLISLLHIFSSICGEHNQRSKHRHILLTIIITNCLWLGATCCFIFTFVFILDSDTSLTKKDFKKEIHFHVILTLYTLTSIFYIYLANEFCEYIIKNPSPHAIKEVKASPKTPKVVSQTKSQLAPTKAVSKSKIITTSKSKQQS